MSPEEKQQLKALFVANSLYFGQQIADQALKLYVEDMEDLPFSAVVEALKLIRRDPKTTRCPLPSVIRAKINPTFDPENQAVLIAAEIVEFISSCGPYQIPPLSEIARRVVQMEGGWIQVCEITTNDNLTALRAQWRGIARGLIQHGSSMRKSHQELEHVSTVARAIDVQKFLPEFPKEPHV